MIDDPKDPIATLTSEQIEKYLNKNWNACFISAMAKSIRDIICRDCKEEDIEEYREELKQLLWEAVGQGVKDYLNEYDGEGVKIVAREFMEEFSQKSVSIKFD